MTDKWYTSAYRRNVIDTHIEDWDESFLSQIDPANYVKMLRLAKVDSTVLYAHSHVGFCNYPTKVGHMHKGLKGRDVFGEIAELCRRYNIKVVAYYSLIFNNWAYDNNPDWRIVRADGTYAASDKDGQKKTSRYGVCCPNSPYRDYIVKEITEICTGYDIDGIRFDMTFWPMVCYCRHCAARYASEVGGQLPTKIDWTDSKWVKFQRCRERWLIEFAAIATNTARRLKPNISVEHQSSTYPLAWQWGVTAGLTEQCDFLQGDFYGGQLQASFACKLLYNLTKNQPFGYETSATYNLGNTYKPKELLRAQAFNAIANSGAFIFIDSIDPIGTINPAVYKTMGEIFSETKAYDSYLGGKLCQDVGVYLSTESKFYPQNNAVADNVSTNAVHEPLPHAENVINTIESLIEYNIPYGVITKQNLNDLCKYKIIILPNVIMMNEAEVQALRKYAAHGGCLYASKYTSLFSSEDGTIKGNFQLGDVLGIKYKGETKEKMTFIAPTKTGAKYMPSFSQKYPVSIVGSQIIIEADKDSKVLGTITLPYTDPADPSRFASIHCNPPGKQTDDPAIISRKFGRGRCVYVAADLENQQYHRRTFINLLLSMYNKFTFESDAPKPVEIIAFEQPEQNRYMVNLLNFQNTVPPLAVENIHIKMNVKSRDVKKVSFAVNKQKLKFRKTGAAIEFTVPCLELFAMIVIEY